jgi:hypothetical protein
LLDQRLVFISQLYIPKIICKKNAFVKKADPSVREARQPNGLVKGHAYTVTKVVRIKIMGADVDLLRIRNPWGKAV